jgi:hypothetical protein
LAWVQADNTLVTGCKNAVAGLAHHLVGKLALQVSDPLLEFGVLVHQFQHAPDALEGNSLGAKSLNLSELGNVLDRIPS